MRHHALASLGYLTIVSYGAWFYGFGVLLDDIVASTGWRESHVVAVASVSALLAGAASLVAGRALDRLGSRTVFAIGIAGSGVLALSAGAQDLFSFAAAAILGGGLLGATGHYHTTLATAAGLHPLKAARAISIVTLYGAFSSTLMLPLGGVLTDRFGWRPALVVYSALAATGYIWAVFAADARPTAHVESAPLRWTPLVATAVAANLLGSAGYGTIGVYQVPIMVALGMSLPLASTLAGVRGVAQFVGRLPTDPIVGRFGSRRALAAANTLIALGAVLLFWAGSTGPALGFAVVAGLGIGAFSPLSGIFAYEVAGPGKVGTLMGMQAAAAGVGLAAGPFGAATLVDLVGDRRASIPLAMVLLVLAAAVLWNSKRFELET
ncbi:MAG: MFS transporter, partial [Acidimicrobiia bacterium]|nr:MFS transporter [Acidimicrobiia bacterium]